MMKQVRLVPNGNGFLRKGVLPRQNELKLPDLDVYDEMQWRMNGGYSIGKTRSHHDGSIDYLDIRHDGERIHFKTRGDDWKPSERLLRYGVAQASYDLRVLEEIATRGGYRVELVDVS